MQSQLDHLDLLDAEQLGLLRLDRRTVYRLLRDGNFPRIVFPHRVVCFEKTVVLDSLKE